MRVFYTYVDNFVDRKTMRENPTSMLRSRTGVLKTQKAPGDATVLKWFFRNNSVTFCRRSKRIAFWSQLIFSTCGYMQIFNFHDGQVTTFWHPSGTYMCQMPGHRLSRLSKGTPSESWHSIGTIGLG